ncbi:MAG: hypothetical protein QOK30_2676, partial [Nocardioidaceae bacterium]|nr:hypothetical protein [Nocardioidaceae bacterium]
MGRLVRRVLWGGVTLVLVILAVMFNHPAKPPQPEVFRNHAAVNLPGYSSNGTLEEPSKSDVAQLVRALDTRARAVLHGDEAAFMSVVDTDRRPFSRGQRVVWANTRQLPLASLSFAYDGTVEPDRPLHTATFLARVTTTYQVAGYDTSPVQLDDGFSFVKHDGTWKLAGVTDADGQFAQKALGAPWEGEAIDTYGDGAYLAVVDRGREALARRIVAMCAEGSRADESLLGVVNNRPTVVLATSHEPGFRKFSSADAEAVTYPLAGPDGVTPGWRVMVNPQDVDQAAASAVVLPHELTHLATQDYLAYLPAWLVEGSAEYIGWHSQGGLPAAMRARGYRWRRTLPDRLPISSGFYLQNIQLDYVEGMALVTWIEEHRGRSALLSLMRAYADAGGRDASYDP